ncbi:ectoine synthase [Cysteiniphilum sp. 19S12-1]|uniref:ectoine synthase n=1 Tax=Cysteiniphilum sp. 19S12-1 TaxID=3453130 RepID=UPI003F859D3D
MFIRKLQDIIQSNNVVKDPNGSWESRRLILAKDNMGFSLHDTIIYAHKSMTLHYKNHLEAVYCIEGKGSVTELNSGKVNQISKGVLYALDKHDKHILAACDNMRIICIFNPALHGNEVHDNEGSYPLAEIEH